MAISKPIHNMTLKIKYAPRRYQNMPLILGITLKPSVRESPVPPTKTRT